MCKLRKKWINCPLHKEINLKTRKIAEDQEKETGTCTPLDTVILTLVKTRYPGIPLAMAATVIKPEKEPEEGA